jgi:hypothetical protein
LIRPAQAEPGARALRLHEAGGRFSLLPLPSREVAVLQAAAGIVAGAPDSDGRARTLERLIEGGPQALLLASEILQEALIGGAVLHRDPG